MDCYTRALPSLTSRRFIRRVIAAILAPVLLLSFYLGGLLTIVVIDGAGLLPFRVKQCVGIAALPVAWYKDAGLPGVSQYERMMIAAYELGQKTR